MNRVKKKGRNSVMRAKPRILVAMFRQPMQLKPGASEASTTNPSQSILHPCEWRFFKAL